MIGILATLISIAVQILIIYIYYILQTLSINNIEAGEIIASTDNFIIA